MNLARIREAIIPSFSRKYPIYGDQELQMLRKASAFNSQLMDMIRDQISPGITTGKLDQLAADYIRSHGHTAACLGYKGFPKSICTSVNDVVCHGIPDDIELHEGDIVNVDVTSIVDGWYGDQSETFFVGKVSDEARALTQVTFDALHVGIQAARPYCTVYDIAKAITRHAESRGYSVVRSYQGHGIGTEFHQQPGIPHYPHDSTRKNIIVPGCCFTIEPMINIGIPDTFIEPDGWTVKTKDGSLSAQFEHQIFMTKDGPEILTQTQNGPQEGHCFK
ncbi:MAG: type I methionyl aminopeptidase [Planctomycetaceae bacterium]|nr:type I methionyl aminopeptidase [Planctomycetaceae bacterium]